MRAERLKLNIFSRPLSHQSRLKVSTPAETLPVDSDLFSVPER